EIDGDNLPPGFRLGDKASWRVEIPDDQKHAVSFDIERTVSYERDSANARIFLDMGLFVHPPLPPNEGLGFRWTSAGHATYNRSTCNLSHVNCSVERRVELRQTHQGSDAILGGWWPHRSNNSHMELTLEVRQDNDKWSETIDVTINKVPSGFKIGKIPTFTLFIHDDDV
ncbi:MAG: hypothetical protein OXE98_09530, partial [Hyphomicrobiales bacterium]|nr:hypothetical protein [Hyphomicrobiales bacterium]